MKKLDYVDPETGEICKGTLVFYPYKEKIKEAYCMVFQDACLLLGQDKELTGEAYRILWVLYGNLEYENIIHLRQTDISEALGIHRAAVSRTMKLLLKKGIIYEVKDFGKPKYYKFNPDYVWKGGARNLKEVRKQRTKKCIEEMINHD